MNPHEIAAPEIAAPQIAAPRRRFSEIAAPSPAIYLLRTAQQHHQAISAMADRKANILITVSSIVLTLAMANVREPTLRYGLLVLGAFTLLSLLFAVFAILPRLPSGGLVQDDPQFNLLFFGHFAQQDEERFLDRLDRVLADQALTFEAMAHDLYSLGAYLHGRKYRLLRFSYLCLLAGFVLGSAVALATTL
ncbi:MAG TPA: Pycsar system effector family protein [Thermoanaerobaculia bacterium]|nr:Pycsar system effector family protein [Thermoanaerobaculia bacterium]